MSTPVYRELKRALILSPIAIPIGAVIAFVIMTIIFGDPGAAFGLIALSIICTAGISLIIWIPVCYILGYMVILVLRMGLKAVGVDIGAMFSRRKDDSSSSSTSSQKNSQDNRLDEKLTVKSDLTRDQVALINYIRKAKQKGLSNDIISRNLGQNGWAADSISQAFRLAEQG